MHYANADHFHDSLLYAIAREPARVRKAAHATSDARDREVIYIHTDIYICIAREPARVRKAAHATSDARDREVMYIHTDIYMYRKGARTRQKSGPRHQRRSR